MESPKLLVCFKLIRSRHCCLMNIIVWCGSQPLHFTHSHTIPWETIKVNLILGLLCTPAFSFKGDAVCTGDGDRASILAHLPAVQQLSRELTVVCVLCCVCSFGFLYMHNQIFTAVLSIQMVAKCTVTFSPCDPSTKCYYLW